MSGSTCRRIGSTFTFCRRASPLLPHAMAKVWGNSSSAWGRWPRADRGRSDGRLRDRRGCRAGGGFAAGRVGQSGASAPLRPGARAPREDRSDRRGHDRPVRRGDQAGLRELHDEATQLLVDLVARHRQIIEMIVAERNREKRFAAMRIPKSLARLIAALEKELSEIDAEIDASVRGSPAWRSPHVQGRRWMCLLELMCRRIGWTSASGQAAKPCRQA